MTRIDLVDTKIRTATADGENAEEVRRVYAAVTGPWVDDYDQERLAQEEPWANNEFIAGAG